MGIFFQFFFCLFVCLFAYENNLFCPCWEIGSLMDLNTGEMTGLSKHIIFSKKLRKNGILSSVCNSMNRAWYIKEFRILS